MAVDFNRAYCGRYLRLLANSIDVTASLILILLPHFPLLSSLVISMPRPAHLSI